MRHVRAGAQEEKAMQYLGGKADVGNIEIGLPASALSTSRPLFRHKAAHLLWPKLESRSSI